MFSRGLALGLQVFSQGFYPTIVIGEVVVTHKTPQNAVCFIIKICYNYLLCSAKHYSKLFKTLLINSTAAPIFDYRNLTNTINRLEEENNSLKKAYEEIKELHSYVANTLYFF